MKPIRIFRHTNCGTHGYLCEFLTKRNIPFDVTCVAGDDPTESSRLPASLDDVSGLIFMGGPGDVNSAVTWMQQEIALIKQAAQHGTPIMGVCLGAQMISKALGGESSSDYRLEVGWHHVEPDTESTNAHWFADLPSRFEVFQWHAHDFTLPPGATSLLSSRCTPHQAFSLGNILAMQFHMEITADKVRHLTKMYAGDMEHSSSCVQDAQEMCDHVDSRVKNLHSTADKIYSRWLLEVTA